MTSRRATALLALLAAVAPLATARAAPPEPEMRRIVLEDDAVRIEEVRVRGQVQRISVTPKAAGARPFEIVPADPARDVSQQRGLTGQRLWNLFSF